MSRKCENFTNIYKNNAYFKRRREDICVKISLNPLEWKMFQTKVVGKNQNTIFMFNSSFFRKSHPLQWKPLIMITLGLALFDNNNRLITLSGRI